MSKKYYIFIDTKHPKNRAITEDSQGGILPETFSNEQTRWVIDSGYSQGVEWASLPAAIRLLAKKIVANDLEKQGYHIYSHKRFFRAGNN